MVSQRGKHSNSEVADNLAHDIYISHNVAPVGVDSQLGQCFSLLLELQSFGTLAL